MISFFEIYVAHWHEWWPDLQAAAANTLALTGYSYLIAIVFGLIVALAKLSRSRLLSGVATTYVELMRGVPTLVILFLLYFGLVPLGVTFNAFNAGAIGLGIHAAAYVAEIFRGGIEAIHKGQREAALAVGMTPNQCLRSIILPQAVGIMMPPLLNMLVILLKDTSICSLISTPEMMLRAKEIASIYFRPMHLYVLAGAMYFVMAWPLSLAARRLGKRFRRGRRD
jgi:His/Glu/Gln/Arg/opine family amino acid ABC transporter permease subunit